MSSRTNPRATVAVAASVPSWSRTPRVPLLFVALLLLLRGSTATLTLISAPSHSTLLQYGYGQTTQNFLLVAKARVISTSSYVETPDSDIITSHEVTVTKMTENQYNVSATLNFEGFPGKATYRIHVQTLNEGGEIENHVFDGMHEVLGAVFYEDSESDIDTSSHTLKTATTGSSSRVAIRSGDDADGITLPAMTTARQAGARAHSLKMRLWPADADVRKAVIRVSHSTRREDGASVLAEEDVRLMKGGLLIRPALGRTGTGRAFVHVEMPDIQVDGESFETVTVVTVR